MKTLIHVTRKDSLAWKVLQKYLPLRPGQIIVCNNQKEFNSFSADFCSIETDIPDTEETYRVFPYKEPGAYRV